jgi:hypothetical protein
MWKKRYRDFLAILLILVLGVFFMADLSKPGLFTSHDSPAHMTRMLAYDEGLRDGQFPVLWAGRVLWGIGSPVLMLNYQLPYYVIQAFHTVGLSLTDSYKLVLALSFIGSGLVMYGALRARYAIPASLVGAMLYMIAPYRLVDIYVRGALGECVAFLFPPLLLLSFWKKSYPLSIASFAGLFLSHPVGSAIFSGYFFFYAAISDFKLRKLDRLKFFALSFGGALLIAAFNLIPTLALTKYTQYHPESSNTLNQFPTFSQLIYSPWGYGHSTDSPIDQMSFQLGVVHWAVFLLAIPFLLYVKKWGKNWELLYNLILSVLAIFFMVDISTWFYIHFKLVKIIDFPWRILMFIMFTSAVMGTELLSCIKAKKIIFLLAVGIIASLVYTNRNNRRINMVWPWKEQDFWGWTADAYGEYAAIYRETRDGSGFEYRAEYINGKGLVSVVENRSNYLLVNSEAESKTTVRINIMYFPGWVVRVDGAKQEIDTVRSTEKTYSPCYVTRRSLLHIDDSGLIACYIPPGKHTIEARYEPLPVQKLSNLITLAGIGGYIWILFRSFYQPSTKKTR